MRTTEKLIAAGQYAEAVAQLSQATPSVQSHLLASKALDGLNQPARAVEEAEAALSLDPRSEAAHLQLGQIFLSRNTPAGALEVFSDALGIHPGSLLLRLGKGLALKDLARYEDAEAELLACLKLRPGFPLAFDTLATVYLHSKRYEELKTLAADFRTVQPNDYRGPYFAAAALEASRQIDASVEALLAESIRLNPRFAAAYALLGKVRLQAGQYPAAIEALEKAQSLRPDYGPAALHLAQAYKQAGRDADAARQFKRVRELKEKEKEGPLGLRYHRGKN